MKKTPIAFILVCVIIILLFIIFNNHNEDLYLDTTYKEPFSSVKTLKSDIINIPVFVINLKQRKTRKKNMTRLLKNLGFKNVTFVVPVDKYSAIKFHKDRGVKITGGSASRSLTTLKIFDMVEKLKLKEFIIAEDDIDIFDNICTVDDVYNASKGIDYDLLFFEMCYMNCSKASKIQQCLYKLHDPLCNGFILHKTRVNNKIKNYFVKNLHEQPMDVYIGNMTRKGLIKSYGYPIFRQNPMAGSTIETSPRYTDKKVKFDTVCYL